MLPVTPAPGVSLVVRAPRVVGSVRAQGGLCRSCVTLALCPPDRGHAAPVHRGPIPAEDAARAARTPPAGPAAVCERATHGRHPVGRRQHPVWRLRAAISRYLRAAGAAGPGLRPAATAASAAGTCHGRDVPPAQDHQNVNDGTTGQRTSATYARRTPSAHCRTDHPTSPHRPRPTRTRTVPDCSHLFLSFAHPLLPPPHTPTTPLILAPPVYTRFVCLSRFTRHRPFVFFSLPPCTLLPFGNFLRRAFAEERHVPRQRNRVHGRHRHPDVRGPGQVQRAHSSAALDHRQMQPNVGRQRRVAVPAQDPAGYRVARIRQGHVPETAPSVSVPIPYPEVCSENVDGGFEHHKSTPPTSATTRLPSLESLERSGESAPR